MKTSTPPGLAEFMTAYRRHCPHYDDEISVERMARILCWDVARVRAVAEWARGRSLIEVDAGLGDVISMLEGRSGT